MTENIKDIVKRLDQVRDELDRIEVEGFANKLNLASAITHVSSAAEFLKELK
jgi:hypothetical protein